MGRICQEAGSKTFLLSPSSIQRTPNPFHTSPDRLEAKAALTAQPEDTLSGVPQEYHEFRNVFSGEKANMLAPHQLYDLKINLEDIAEFVVLLGHSAKGVLWLCCQCSLCFEPVRAGMERVRHSLDATRRQ